jgi:hypothetical protein
MHIVMNVLKHRSVCVVYKLKYLLLRKFSGKLIFGYCSSSVLALQIQYIFVTHQTSNSNPSPPSANEKLVEEVILLVNFALAVSGGSQSQKSGSIVTATLKSETVRIFLARA